MHRKLSMDELGRKSPRDFRESAKFPLVLVLDNVRSMMNTGSVFRTADAFLVEAIYLCGITATPPHREIHKTALGATESVRWEYFRQTPEAVSLLKAQGYIVLAIEQVRDSISLRDFRPESGQKYALVFGHEVKGVGEEVLEICDGCLEIPQFGTKHSLNVSVTAGMVIWDFYCKLQG
jgi:23S rRNA (guanosine2251-2'-O)-methyltransferase